VACQFHGSQQRSCLVGGKLIQPCLKFLQIYWYLAPEKAKVPAISYHLSVYSIFPYAQILKLYPLQVD
jgi:hypothetical protein